MTSEGRERERREASLSTAVCVERTRLLSLEGSKDIPAPITGLTRRFDPYFDDTIYKCIFIGYYTEVIVPSRFSSGVNIYIIRHLEQFFMKSVGCVAYVTAAAAAAEAAVGELSYVLYCI